METFFFIPYAAYNRRKGTFFSRQATFLQAKQPSFSKILYLCRRF